MATKLTIAQEKNNYGAFIHEKLYLSEITALVKRLEILEGRPAIPGKPTGTVDAATGKITLEIQPVKDAKSYIIHYTNPNDTEPRHAIYMGYVKAAASPATTTWTLPANLIPAGAVSGDRITFFIQAYKEEGQGATDVDKANYLHDGQYWGSEWSAPVTVVVK